MAVFGVSGIDAEKYIGTASNAEQGFLVVDFNMPTRHSRSDPPGRATVWFSRLFARRLVMTFFAIGNEHAITVTQRADQVPHVNGSGI